MRTISPKQKILIALFTLLSSLGIAAQQESIGVYRIPYADGTRVRISGDFADHKPVGRIDMSGVGTRGPFRIVAAASGTIRKIVDGFDEKVSSDSGRPCTNNYVWISHSNGEWTKYSHMKRGSTTGEAGLREGQFVTAGRFLGYEDEVGCASGPHLHFEVGVPRATNPYKEVGGFLNDNNGSMRNRIPRICGIRNKQFNTGSRYTARKIVGNLARGLKEVVRYGLNSSDLGCFIDQGRSSGYRPIWIDGYDSNNKNFFNVILRPSRIGTKWAAEYNLTKRELSTKILEHKANGLKLMQLESYKKYTAIKYAAVFQNRPGRPAVALGLTRNRHQQNLNDYKKIGKRPEMISVVSIGGIRRYTTLFQENARFRIVAKSALDFSAYKALDTANKAKGLQISYLNAYVHDGKLHFSAVWNSKTRGTDRIIYSMNPRHFIRESNSSKRLGYLTRFVTGYATGRNANFAVVWRK